MGTVTGVLITGAMGQVGLELQALLPSARALSRSDLDVTDGDAVRRAVQGQRVVVHLAAMTDVDACEFDEREAVSVNHMATTNLAEACAEHGCHMVYVSTDYVFDGEKPGEYLETDATNPLSVYGATKLAGEEPVLASGGSVVRTSTVYGQGRNFVRAILSFARSGRSVIEVVSDQTSRHTHARDVARALFWTTQERPGGIFHAAGAGMPLSRADLAAEIIALAGAQAEIIPVTTAEYEAHRTEKLAPRPQSSVLSLGKAAAAGVPLGDQGEALGRYVREQMAL